MTEYWKAAFSFCYSRCEGVSFITGSGISLNGSCGAVAIYFPDLLHGVFIFLFWNLMLNSILKFSPPVDFIFKTRKLTCFISDYLHLFYEESLLDLFYFSSGCQSPKHQQYAPPLLNSFCSCAVLLSNAPNVASLWYSALPPPLQAGTFSRGVVTMRCDLSTSSSAHISLLVSGSAQTCFDDLVI